MPADPAGAVAVTDVGESTVYDVAGTEPKSTTLVPTSPVPVTVTAVPPTRGPAAGLTAVTPGAFSYQKFGSTTRGETLTKARSLEFLPSAAFE